MNKKQGLVLIVVSMVVIAGLFAVVYLTERKGSDDSHITPVLALNCSNWTTYPVSYVIRIVAISNLGVGLDRAEIMIDDVRSPLTLEHYENDSCWVGSNFNLTFIDGNNNSYLDTFDFFTVAFWGNSNNTAVQFRILYKENGMTMGAISIQING